MFRGASEAWAVPIDQVKWLIWAGVVFQFFGYGPTGHSGGWKLRPRWRRLMGAVVTPGWPVTLPCARVNLPWPMGRLPAQSRCAITAPVVHRWFCAPRASALTDGRCSAGQERPCRYSLGPIDHPEKTGRYQPALPYVCGVWCLCCTHTAAPTPGPKTCGWVHSRPTPRIFGACLGPNKRAQSAEPPPGP